MTNFLERRARQLVAAGYPDAQKIVDAIHEVKDKVPEEFDYRRAPVRNLENEHTNSFGLNVKDLGLSSRTASAFSKAGLSMSRDLRDAFARDMIDPINTGNNIGPVRIKEAGDRLAKLTPEQHLELDKLYTDQVARSIYKKGGKSLEDETNFWYMWVEPFSYEPRIIALFSRLNEVEKLSFLGAMRITKESVWPSSKDLCVKDFRKKGDLEMVFQRSFGKLAFERAEFLRKSLA